MTAYRIRVLSGIALILLFGLLIWIARPQDIADVSHYGQWSLLPAVVTIAVCFITRNVLLALFLGVFTGGMIIGSANIIDAFLVPSLGSERYAVILLVNLWALGGLLGLWNRTGGARHFASGFANAFIKSRVTAKLFAWFMGIIFHQGGTTSTVLTGTTAKAISDQHKVSHEELSYVVDSTASPIATLIPFNIWPFYVAGLIATLPQIGGQEAAVSLFYQSIPFNFYAFFAVFMTLLLSMDRLPLFGSPMAKAVRRVQETGRLDAPDADPLTSAELTEDRKEPGYPTSILDFALPLGTLLGFCIIPLLFGGSPLVPEGFCMAVVVGVCLTIYKGMSIKDTFEAVVTGIKGMTLGALILGLAVTLALVSGELGTSRYVAEVGSRWLDAVPFVLPTLLLLVCMIISFAIGTSFGTYAVVFPVALPLAFALSPNDTFAMLTFGAVLGGAVFGDQCSPISDTTILSSLATGTDLMAHVNTQFPLALTAAGIAGVLYLIIGYIVV